MGMYTNDLDNYFMKYTKMSNGLKLYPIQIFDYEYYKKIADKYIVLDINSRNNLIKQQYEELKINNAIDKNTKVELLKYSDLHDMIIDILKQQISLCEIIDIIEENKESENIPKDLLSQIKLLKSNNEINDLIDLFKKVTKCDTIYVKGSSFFICFKDEGKEYKINRKLFKEFRNIVMEQNLFFEPIIAPNLESQSYIDMEIRHRNGDDSEYSLESLVCFVTINSNKDVSNYTYYRLKADYSMLLKTMYYNNISIFIANGCKNENGSSIEYPNLLEPLKVSDNPYDVNNFFRDSKLTKFEKDVLEGKI